MKIIPLTGLVLAASVVAAPSIAQPLTQPPMNGFNFAFYTCDKGGAFQISYDSDKPTEATLTTSNNSRTYTLKREPVSNGVQFSSESVTFWTDRNSVSVKGTEIPLNNCKLKGN